MNDEPWPPKPVKPTLDELLDNAAANMAIEGYYLTPEEIARVRAWAFRELAPRWDRVEVPKRSDFGRKGEPGGEG